MMFEVGKEYQLVFGEHHNEESLYGVVEAYQHPLISFRENQSGNVTIYNIGAINFLRAEPR